MRRTICFALVLLLATELAPAAPAAEARFFDDMARRAFASGAYAEALDEFLLAHSIAPSARSLYNIALCAELAGKAEVAFAHYREYLSAADPDQKRHAEATQRFDKLKTSLALIEVDSVPPGATVYADRIELGSQGTTPTVIVVAPGEHQLILEEDGFVSATLPASAERGQVKKASASLAPRLGELDVALTPSHAKLEFVKDGRPLSVTGKDGHFVVQVGNYVLRASAPGYAPREAQVSVREGTRATINVTALPLPKPTGRLLLASPDAVAEVYIDGVRVAVTPATLPNVGIGQRSVEMRARGRRWKHQVLVRAGQASYLEARWPQFE